MLMDAATDFGGNYTPSDADNLERGPVRVRTALQFSLNIPSVKAAQINTPDRDVRRAPRTSGWSSHRTRRTPGSSIALGVQEVRPVDLVTAYGTLANGGKKIGHTTILSVRDQAGKDVGSRRTQPPAGEQVGEPPGRVHRHRHPGRQHEPEGQPVLGQVRPHRARRTSAGRRRSRPARTTTPRTSTPTASSRRRPTPAGRRASTPSRSAPGTATATTRSSAQVFSIDVTTFVWQGFLQEATKAWAVNDFAPARRPRPGEDRPVHRPASRSPAPRRSTSGTSPDTAPAGHDPGRRLRRGRPRTRRASYEHDYNELDDRRPRLAEPGASTGRASPGGVNRTRTAYFYNGVFQPFGRSWGALVDGPRLRGAEPVGDLLPGPDRPIRAASSRRSSCRRRIRRPTSSSSRARPRCRRRAQRRASSRSTEAPTPTPTEAPTPTPTDAGADADSRPAPTPTADPGGVGGRRRQRGPVTTASHRSAPGRGGAGAVGSRSWRGSRPAGPTGST